ncbi:type I restriction enzyme, S subunit [Arachidicoccus rhizosphaerae]|uniref:Type I restriction enzyme, S subunit n=1 Tax=Arachidicoccus rhizosphaerae TaxID=551991 RepID=A0A1H4B0P4_9BACT|nr:restriction endonuclease subunit S [Arachidicoccus rhizosphaerae]SEA41627.1 type I restriction enzyme, S subunit [Arachidicoccus rhizosphaerae]
MSKIDRLIAKYCPNGVEFKALGQIATIQRGASPRPIQDYITNDENAVPWIKIGDTKAGSKYVINTAQKITTEGAKKSRILKKGDLIISNSMSYGRPYILGIAGAIHDGWASISNFENNLNTDFLYHYLTSSFVKSYWDSKINSGSVSNLNADIIKTLETPVPPLPIQEEIVKILDSFTTLEAELEAELEARTRQYEYYRNQLLSFEGKDVEWKTLGEVCLKVSSGGTPLSTNKQYYDGEIPWLRTQEVRFNDILETEIKISELALKESSAKWIPENCVIIAISGATAARSAINKIPLTTNQHCCNLEIDPKIALYRYVFHWVSCKYMQLQSLGQGARNDLNSSIIKSFPIPIPTLEEQERIVGILDKFDSLVNGISDGLPAEIQARRQQYEYYRGQLLNFTPVS